MLIRCGEALLPGALSIVLSLSVAPTAALAIQPTSQRSQQRTPAAAEPRKPLTAAVEFGGGPLSEYVAAVKQRYKNLSVVLDPEAAAILVPPISLTSASAAAALRVVQATSAALEKGLVVQAVSEGAAEDEVYVISLRGGRDAVRPTRQALNPTRRVKVFSIRDLTDSSPTPLSAEGIQATVASGLGMHKSGADEPAVRFDSGSSLLMVRGTTEELQLVEQVVTELSTHFRTPERSGESGGIAQIQELESKVKALQIELAEIKRSIQRSKK